MDYDFPHFTDEEKGAERLSNLPKVTQLEKAELGFQLRII